MDVHGNFTCRFPHTSPFDLWRLTYLSDYVLQQSMFFRADIYRAIGGIREDYHWTLDWDLLIRIGKLHPLVYLPYYMGALREHEAAKTFYGGKTRSREIARMLREHTGMIIPPGWAVYGLDTFAQIWRARIAGLISGPLSEALQNAVTLAAGLTTVFLLNRYAYRYAGWFEDNWVAPHIHYMLPAGDGNLLIEGELPDNQWLSGQMIHLQCNGVTLGSYPLARGPFSLRIPTHGAARGQAANLDIRATHHYMPTRFGAIHDARKFAYKLKRITWADWV
jgi:hypothetical protein